MRTIKIYFKRAPFYNALIRTLALPCRHKRRPSRRVKIAEIAGVHLVHANRHGRDYVRDNIYRPASSLKGETHAKILGDSERCFTAAFPGSSELWAGFGRRGN